MPSGPGCRSSSGATAPARSTSSRFRPDGQRVTVGRRSSPTSRSPGTGGIARARAARAGGRGVDAGRRRPFTQRLVRQRQPHPRTPAGSNRETMCSARRASSTASPRRRRRASRPRARLGLPGAIPLSRDAAQGSDRAVPPDLRVRRRDRGDQPRDRRRGVTQRRCGQGPSARSCSTRFDLDGSAAEREAHAVWRRSCSAPGCWPPTTSELAHRLRTVIVVQAPIRMRSPSASGTAVSPTERSRVVVDRRAVRRPEVADRVRRRRAGARARRAGARRRDPRGPGEVDLGHLLAGAGRAGDRSASAARPARSGARRSRRKRDPAASQRSNCARSALTTASQPVAVGGGGRESRGRTPRNSGRRRSAARRTPGTARGRADGEVSVSSRTGQLGAVGCGGVATARDRHRRTGRSSRWSTTRGRSGR